MSLLAQMAENGWLPDQLSRFGIRRLDKNASRKNTGVIVSNCAGGVPDLLLIRIP